MDAFIDPTLLALFDTIVPGEEGWPRASETQVPVWISKRAADLPHLREAIDAVGALLPADFAGRDLASKTSALREVEARVPVSLTHIVDEAYRGYYTDVRVLALIERKTRYPARPPQPLGRSVRPADWSVLNARRIAPEAPSKLPDSSGEIT